MKRSKTSSSTSAARASGRSILLITTIGGRPASSALRSTKRVCGSGPSLASTSSSTPSTIFSVRSTSPPKSAWPGVSMMLIRVPRKWMEVFLAMMVMPFSRSRSIESITRSATCSLARKMPLCQSIASTSVVLPWSTWAMMARLRTSSRVSEVKPVLSISGGGISWWKSYMPRGDGEDTTTWRRRRRSGALSGHAQACRPRLQAPAWPAAPARTVSTSSGSK